MTGTIYRILFTTITAVSGLVLAFDALSRNSILATIASFFIIILSSIQICFHFYSEKKRSEKNTIEIHNELVNEKNRRKKAEENLNTQAATNLEKIVSALSYVPINEIIKQLEMAKRLSTLSADKFQLKRLSPMGGDIYLTAVVEQSFTEVIRKGDPINMFFQREDSLKVLVAKGIVSQPIKAESTTVFILLETISEDFKIGFDEMLKVESNLPDDYTIEPDCYPIDQEQINVTEAIKALQVLREVPNAS